MSVALPLPLRRMRTWWVNRQKRARVLQLTLLANEVHADAVGLKRYAHELRTERDALQRDLDAADAARAASSRMQPTGWGL